MQIDRHQAIHAGARNHVRHELRRDGRARRARPAILARVAEIRHHGGDPGCGGTPERIHHHEQLHQGVVRGRTRRLYDKHVAPARVLHQLDPALTIAEVADFGVAESRLQMPCDVLRQGKIRITGKQGQRVARSHVTRFE